MKEHNIPIEDGKISAIHHESGNKRWIFLCHGFGGNKDRGNKRRAKYLNNKGWNAVRFDFRGNGASSGDFIDQDLSSRIKDLKTVIDYFDPENYAVFATSFGGKVALHASEDLENLNCLFLKAPVTYNSIMSGFNKAVENKGRFEYIEGKPIDKRFFEDFAKYKYENIKEEIDVPLGIIHGSKDTTVHIENSYKAVQNLEVDTSVFSIKGERHSFSDDAGEKLRRLMISWLKNYY